MNRTTGAESSSFALPLIGAVFVHLVIAGLLFGSWQLSFSRPIEFAPPQHIEAELVTLAPPPTPTAKAEQPSVKKPQQPVPKPKPKPKPKPAAAKKVAPKPATPPVAKEPEPAVKKVAPSAPQAEPAPTPPEVPAATAPVDPLLQEDDLFAALAAENNEFAAQRAAVQQAEQRSAEIREQVSSYKERIMQQVSRQWSRPTDQLKDISSFEAEVRVEILPTGELKKVTLTRTSGNAIYDRSVIRAIEKVRRFDVPEDPEVFEKGEFRRLSITFAPEDLMG